MSKMFNKRTTYLHNPASRKRPLPKQILSQSHLHVINRGHYMRSRGYEFHLRVFNSITSERSERVRYRVEHERIKFVTTSGHVILCLLYKHTNNDVSDDFLKISDHFPKISENFPNLFRRLDERFRIFPNILRRLPTISEVNRRFSRMDQLTN